MDPHKRKIIQGLTTYPNILNKTINKPVVQGVAWVVHVLDDNFGLSSKTYISPTFLQDNSDNFKNNKGFCSSRNVNPLLKNANTTNLARVIPCNHCINCHPILYAGIRVKLDDSHMRIHPQRRGIK